MLDNCCFCMKLRLGALIIAYIQLIGHIIGLVWVFIKMAALGAQLAKGDVVTRGLEEAFVFICVLLLIMITCLIFDILLLVGIIKKKRGCITAYLVFSAILTTLAFTGFIRSIFAGGYDVSAFISHLITILLNVYCLIVIKSYQVTIDEGAGQVLYIHPKGQYDRSFSELLKCLFMIPFFILYII